MSEQLKPCPFCGSEAEFKVSQGLFWIGCGGVPKCLAMSGMLLANRDMAIAAWNTRVHYSELTSANARAEKAEKERDCWKRGCHKAQDDGDALRNLLTHSTDVAKEPAAAFMALKKSRNSADDECTRLSLALLDAEKERDALKRQVEAIIRVACGVCPPSVICQPTKQNSAIA